MYCVICMSAAAYKINHLARAGSPTDGAAIALVAVASFFGLFSGTMAMLSLRFAFTNITNIESLRSATKVHQLAIRIPLNQTPSSDATSTTTIDYEIITFPLTDPNASGNQSVRENPGTTERPPPAEHRFAIVKTEIGDNPWDTGSYYKNFTSVMGNGPLDWLLPLRLSPCCAYNGEYPVGPAVDRLRERLKK